MSVTKRLLARRDSEPLDERTQVFLALVECDPSEVLDVSRWGGRHSTGAPAPGGPGSPSQADPVLHFGKHRGKRLSEIPRDYLAWLADQESAASSKDFLRACRAARRILDGRFPSV